METLLLKKKTRKTAKKSRTITRPALKRKDIFDKHPGLRILIGVGYVLAVVTLGEYMYVQMMDDTPQGSLSFSGTAVYAKEPVKPLQVNAKQAKATVVKVTPTRIKIPSIKVDALINSVGLRADGSMDTPKLPRDTAWYSLGPKPGEVGSAVIAGHVNWWNGATGAFGNLHNLKVGSLITVQNSHGTTTTFIVKSKREYRQNENASSVFLSYDGKSHLNLVTCSGVWNKVLKMYSKRLVVFADKVEK